MTNRADIKLYYDSGFTLIELSIVLVIIGLVVGGILVGRDMIRAAEIRATVSQIEKYKTSTNAFRIKYGVLPGDMTPTQASRLGFLYETGGSGGTQMHGDGNGYIQGSGGFENEHILFWRHLSEAQMIDGRYGFIGNAAIDPVTATYTATLLAGEIKDGLPPTKLGRNSFYLPEASAYGSSPAFGNYFMMFGASQIYPTIAHLAITPIEAAEIDSKLDDGKPSDGKVIGTSGNCITVDNLYDVGSTNGDTPQCTMVVPF